MCGPDNSFCSVLTLPLSLLLLCPVSFPPQRPYKVSVVIWGRLQSCSGAINDDLPLATQTQPFAPSMDLWFQTPEVKSL